MDWGPGQNKEKGRWAPPFVTFCFLSRGRHVARCFMSPWSCHLLRDQLYSPSLSWKKLLSCFCQVFFFSNKESNQYKHFNINWLGFKSFAMEWNQLSRRMGRVYSWSSHLPLPSSTVLFNVLIMCCLIYQITSALDVGKSSLHSCQLCLAKKTWNRAGSGKWECKMSVPCFYLFDYAKFGQDILMTPRTVC